MSRAAGRVIRSSSRRRMRWSSDRVISSPSSVVQVLGRGRIALEAMAHEASGAGSAVGAASYSAWASGVTSAGVAKIDSSPRREEITRPWTKR
ncbi:Uncharacterised protein [Mycobacteroides abscessus subsp. abscessus]|nr:Uncharacterised protein [Mycobacteroides abscessus subsp. abscessus]